MKQDEIIEMARQAGLHLVGTEHNQVYTEVIEDFAKLVAAHAVAKDRKEFDIDELCARQNKIGYKQGYNAGVLAEREACVKIAEQRNSMSRWESIAATIRARGEA